MSDDFQDLFDDLEEDDTASTSDDDEGKKKRVNLDPTLERDKLEGDRAFDGPMPGDKWLDG